MKEKNLFDQLPCEVNAQILKFLSPMNVVNADKSCKSLHGAVQQSSFRQAQFNLWAEDKLQKTRAFEQLVTTYHKNLFEFLASQNLTILFLKTPIGMQKKNIVNANAELLTKMEKLLPQVDQRQPNILFLQLFLYFTLRGYVQEQPEQVDHVIYSDLIAQTRHFIIKLLENNLEEAKRNLTTPYFDVKPETPPGTTRPAIDLNSPEHNPYSFKYAGYSLNTKVIEDMQGLTPLDFAKACEQFSPGMMALLNEYGNGLEYRPS